MQTFNLSNYFSASFNKKALSDFFAPFRVNCEGWTQSPNKDDGIEILLQDIPGILNFQLLVGSSILDKAYFGKYPKNKSETYEEYFFRLIKPTIIYTFKNKKLSDIEIKKLMESITRKISRSYSPGFSVRLDNGYHDFIHEYTKATPPKLIQIGGKNDNKSLNLIITESGSVYFQEKTPHGFIYKQDMFNEMNTDFDKNIGSVMYCGELTENGAKISSAFAETTLIRNLFLPVSIKNNQPQFPLLCETLPEITEGNPKQKSKLIEKGKKLVAACEQILSDCKLAKIELVQFQYHYKLNMLKLNNCMKLFKDAVEDKENAVFKEEALEAKIDLLRWVDVKFSNAERNYTIEQHRYFLNKYGAPYFLHRLKLKKALEDINLFKSLNVNEVLWIKDNVKKHFIKFLNEHPLSLKSALENPLLATLIIKNRHLFFTEFSHEILIERHKDNWAYQFALAKRFKKPLLKSITLIKKGWFSMNINWEEIDHEIENVSTENLPVLLKKGIQISVFPQTQFWQLIPHLTHRELLNNSIINRLSPTELNSIALLALKIANNIPFNQSSLSSKELAMHHLADAVIKNSNLMVLLYKKMQSDILNSANNRDVNLKTLTLLATADKSGYIAKKLLSTSFWAWPKDKKVRNHLSKEQIDIIGAHFTVPTKVRAEIQTLWKKSHHRSDSVTDMAECFEKSTNELFKALGIEHSAEASTEERLKIILDMSPQAIRKEFRIAETECKARLTESECIIEDWITSLLDISEKGKGKAEEEENVVYNQFEILKKKVAKRINLLRPLLERLEKEIDCFNKSQSIYHETFECQVLKFSYKELNKKYEEMHKLDSTHSSQSMLAESTITIISKIRNPVEDKKSVITCV